MCPPQCRERKLSRNKRRVRLGHVFEACISIWGGVSLLEPQASSEAGWMFLLCHSGKLKIRLKPKSLEYLLSSQSSFAPPKDQTEQLLSVIGIGTNNCVWIDIYVCMFVCLLGFFFHKGLNRICCVFRKKQNPSDLHFNKSWMPVVSAIPADLFARVW